MEQARLVGLEGTRRTYITRETGRILHTEDTILGKVEFRAGSLQTASARGLRNYTVELTQMQPGMGGMPGGMMPGRRRGGMGRMGARRAPGITGRQPGATSAQRPAALRAGGEIPSSLGYGFTITTDLVTE